MTRTRELHVGDRVYLKAGHPHTGEYATLEAWYPGMEMWKLRLENCPDLTEGCFAASRSLQLSREPSPPTRGDS